MDVHPYDRAGSYYLRERLGEGGQASVYRGVHTHTGAVVALKMLDVSRLTPERRERLQTEITALQRIGTHANVIPLREIVWDSAGPHAGKTYAMLVLDLAERGEFTDYLMDSKFSETVARTYFKQLLEALAFCHSKGVAHRDLKPDNIVLDTGFNLRVTDFGLAAVLDNLFAQLLHSRVGTVKGGYMAPEVNARRMYRPEPADMWSAGVILFIMLAGFPPMDEAGGDDWWFRRLAEHNYALFWAAHEREATFSREAKDLLQAMLMVDPSRRIRLEDVFKHPFCAGPLADPAVLRADMSERRRRILERKGIPLPPSTAEVSLADATTAAPSAAAISSTSIDLAPVSGAAAAAAASPGAGPREGVALPSSISEEPSIGMMDDGLFARRAPSRSPAALTLPSRVPGAAPIIVHALETLRGDASAMAEAAAATIPPTIQFSSLQAEAVPAHRLTYFFHRAATQDERVALAARIVQLVMLAGGTASCLETASAANPCRMQATIPSIGTRLLVTVYAAEPGTAGCPAGASTMVDVERVHGDLFSTQTVFRVILNAVSGGVVGQADARTFDSEPEFPPAVDLSRSVTDTLYTV